MAVIFNLTTLQSVAAPGNDFILHRIYLAFIFTSIYFNIMTLLFKVDTAFFPSFGSYRLCLTVHFILVNRKFGRPSDNSFF